MLAYLRTGLGFSAAGATALHFLAGGKAIAMGTAGFALGLGSVLFGAWRFLSVRSRLDAEGPRPAR